MMNISFLVLLNHLIKGFIVIILCLYSFIAYSQESVYDPYSPEQNTASLETPLLIFIPASAILYERGLDSHGETTPHLFSSGGAFSINFNNWVGLEFSGNYSLLNRREKRMKLNPNPYGFHSLNYHITNFTYRIMFGLKFIEPDLSKRLRLFITPQVGRLNNVAKLEFFSHKQQDFHEDNHPQFLIREEHVKKTNSFFFGGETGAEIKIVDFEDDIMAQGIFFFLSFKYTRSFNDINFLDFDSSKYKDSDEIVNHEEWMTLGISKLNFTKMVKLESNKFHTLGAYLGFYLRF